ncbi:uncharacterized protein KY384_004568 [Bacidia gigantensis]|uniref:uncharacterized protein n=1 Tax=Bacidia gigantensis TaxID=2732470 RepID=UPI001D03EE8E|nr:uncharacterized protein KY384_004568 [Bacidia gigantensis]KAG8531210.1 hypothetical protein KY384_004568 [Bacidia gigantensis]
MIMSALPKTSTSQPRFQEQISPQALRGRSGTLQAPPTTDSRPGTSASRFSTKSARSIFSTLSGKSKFSTNGHHSRTSTLKQAIKNKILRAPKEPEEAEGWVLRPDLLIEMQVAGRGGDAAKVRKDSGLDRMPCRGRAASSASASGFGENFRRGRAGAVSEGCASRPGTSMGVALGGGV